jgi:hypothetical protein
MLHEIPTIDVIFAHGLFLLSGRPKGRTLSPGSVN